MAKMRVSIVGKCKETDSGPMSFMSRIRNALPKYTPVEITDRKPHLVLSSIHSPKTRVKTVLRVDGCYYNRALFNVKANDAIAKSIKRADGVIYQSKFSERMCSKILKARPKTDFAIIPNGIDQRSLKDIAPNKQFDGKYIFVASAKWRETKRPRSILKGFIKANVPDSKLLFVGEYNKRIKDKRIVYLGKLSHKELIGYLKASNAFIHLCMIESCSNAVVEALSCGLPVVCNNIGGTPELVGDDGVIVKSDKKFKFNIINEAKVDSSI